MFFHGHAPGKSTLTRLFFRRKTGETVRAAQAKGLQTDFKTGQEFIQGDFHAKK